MLNPLIAASAAATSPENSVATVAPVTASAVPVKTTQGAETSSTTSSKVASTANPSYVLDLGLNLVVLQFHDGRGDVTQSIPSERQLKAYRDGLTTSPGGPAKA